mgnify:FL=1
MKPTLLLLITALLLASCAPAPTPPPAPTATPTLPPTATATPTPVPTATITPTPIPTLPSEQVGGLTGVPNLRAANPELFNLTQLDAPIPQFVYAMRMASARCSERFGGRIRL